VKFVSGVTREPWGMTPSRGWNPDESKKNLWLNFTKDTEERITWRVEVVTMIKKGHYLLRTMTRRSSVFRITWKAERGWKWWRKGKNKVTPLVTAPGDTNPSNVTEACTLLSRTLSWISGATEIKKRKRKGKVMRNRIQEMERSPTWPLLKIY